MKKMKKSFWGNVRGMIKSIYALDVPVYAANASYFLILAVFPALLLLLSLLRYTSLNHEDLILILDGVIPSSLMPAVSSVIYSIYDKSSTTLISISAVMALWSASRGVYGMLQGLNKIYGVREDRGYFYTRAISMVYMFLFIIVLILTLGLHVFGQEILSYFPQTENPILIFASGLLPKRFVLLLILQTVLFSMMFMVLPNRHNRFLVSLPGALLASLGWLIFSDLFSKYVDIFGGSSAIYGSVSTIAMAMLWLYFCMSIFFYCGAINKYLMDIGFQLRFKREKKAAALNQENQQSGKAV